MSSVVHREQPGDMVSLNLVSLRRCLSREQAPQKMRQAWFGLKVQHACTSEHSVNVLAAGQAELRAVVEATHKPREGDCVQHHVGIR